MFPEKAGQVEFDVIIIGAGAAGLMAAATAGQGGARVLLLDHGRAPGEKIRISGGGRCNFTNTGTGPAHFISQNPHFAKSALSRYTPADFIALVARYGIAFHEKTLGQLFCDGSAKQIIDMLGAECARGQVDIRLETAVQKIEAVGGGYQVTPAHGRAITAANLVIATGGKSIPKMGATGFGYEVARQFGLAVVPTRAGLVPFTFSGPELERLRALAGVAVAARVSAGGGAFEEALLFTHRGLSGPAVLQASSYWQEGHPIALHLLPDLDLAAALRHQRQQKGGIGLPRALSEHLPKRLAAALCEMHGWRGNLADLSDAKIAALVAALHAWTLTPAGTEGYRTAEVTIGGVDTAGLSSKTMESRKHPGLYFIGEVVDVTGWLGGYNFQWAWASAVACGRSISDTI